MVNGTIAVKGTIKATSGYLRDLTLGDVTDGSGTLTMVIKPTDGDTYISGGVGLDYVNWTADKGFILGLDDSDSDLAKFFIGDDANNKYFSFDGTNANATGFRHIESLTAGENISTGNILCVKPAVNDYDTSWTDSYVDTDNATTNYEGSPLKISQVGSTPNEYSYIQLSLAGLPDTGQILKAVIRLKVRGISGAGLSCGIQRVTSSWNASTVTWNTKPTVSAFADGDVISGTIPAVDSWIEFDVTQVLRKIDNGTYSNYGFRLEMITAGTVTASFYDISEAEVDRPHLRVYELDSSDGKVYKADNADYETCRFIAGISTETKSADAVVKVQTGGNNEDVSASAGQNVYVASTGGTTNSTINLTRIIRLGTAINTNKIFIEKEYSNLFIEKNAVSITLASSTGKVIIAPDDAKTMKIAVTTTHSYFDLIVSRIGITSVEQRNWDGGFTQYAKASWSGKEITVTAKDGGSMFYYFYR